jgi:hypothetical protein
MPQVFPKSKPEEQEESVKFKTPSSREAPNFKPGGKTHDCHLVLGTWMFLRLVRHFDDITILQPQSLGVLICSIHRQHDWFARLAIFALHLHA